MRACKIGGIGKREMMMKSGPLAFEVFYVAVPHNPLLQPGFASMGRCWQGFCLTPRAPLAKATSRAPSPDPGYASISPLSRRLTMLRPPCTPPP